MEGSDTLLCLFSADISESEDSRIVEIPRREIERGSVSVGNEYRIALIAAGEEKHDQREREWSHDHPQSPVESGEIRYVEIEDLGKQGDGIARVERGYVIIVPGSKIGQRAKIEITDVKPNFAVAEILEVA